MLPRQQRSFQQPSGSAKVDPFPIYRPPVARSSPAPAAASFGRRPSPSPDEPGRLDRFVVTAYEVDLVNGQRELVRQLELRRGEGEMKQGRLVQCATSSSTEGGEAVDDTAGVWTDRFSHLHLLAALPSTSSGASRPTSPVSDWSSLPSDAEDTWFFSGDEGDEYERHKKRRRLDELRAKRMAQLEPVEEPEPAEDDGDKWGDEDEVPPDVVLTLMNHTAASLSGSPNPSLLIMRILANHGADRRFDFLKGRYAKAWRDVKNPPPKADAMGSLLGGYESSSDDHDDNDGDGDDDEGGGDAAEETPATTDSAKRPTVGPSTDADAAAMPADEQEEEKRRQRREKARLWAAKRKAGDGGAP